MSVSQPCPKCKHSVSTDDTACWQCGFPVPTNAADMSAQEDLYAQEETSAQEDMPAPEDMPAHEDEAGLPKLWNPGAAAAWSLLFTPAFGAYLHAVNWRVLGMHERAAANMAYVWGNLIYILVILGTGFIEVPRFIGSVLGLVPLWLFGQWYTREGKTQSEYVKDNFGDRYNKRGWEGPLLSGFSVVGGGALVLVALVIALERPPLTAKEMAVHIKPIILQEWQKKPELNGASIKNISLVQEDSNRYVGKVDAVISGEPEQLDLEVTQDGQDVSFQFAPTKAATEDPLQEILRSMDSSTK